MFGPETLDRHIPVAVGQHAVELLQAVTEVQRFNGSAVALRFGADTELKLAGSRHMADFAPEVDSPARLQLVPNLPDIRLQCITKFRVHRHIGGGQLQQQLVTLPHRREAAFAEYASGVVAALQVVEGPMVVAHLDRAADIPERIGEFLISHRAPVQADPHVFLRRRLGGFSR